MSKKLHAQHNEKVCEILSKLDGCNDWVVTTAFYSALHYVQHEIFPHNDGYREYPNFESYYNGHRFIGKKPNRHLVTVDLVRDNLPECGKSYKFLYQTCMTARYHNYKIPESISNSSLKHLETVKESLVK